MQSFTIHQTRKQNQEQALSTHKNRQEWIARRQNNTKDLTSTIFSAKKINFTRKRLRHVLFIQIKYVSLTRKNIKLTNNKIYLQ